MLNEFNQKKSKVTKSSSLLNILLLCGALLSLPYIYLDAYNNIWLFDDEGTMMITFKNVMEGWRLFDDAYAMYGPFYYVVIGQLFSVLQLPLTHDVARGIAALFWLADTLLLASLVYKVTGSIAASALAFVTALFMLEIFTHSPLHPEELCLVMVACLLHFLCRIEKQQSTPWLIVIGIIVGGLLLTKFNAGVFVAMPLLLVAIRASSRNQWQNAAFLALAAIGIMLPTVLMKPLFIFDWAVWYCVFSTATIGPAIMVWWRSDVETVFTLKSWVAISAAVVITMVLTIAIVLTRGTTPYAILYTVILQNPDHILNWYIPLYLNQSAFAAGVFGSATALAYVIFVANRKTEDWARTGVSALKLAVGGSGVLIVIYVSQRGLPWRDLPKDLLNILMPFCWLLVVPPRGTPQVAVTRGAFGLIAAFFILYAFPIGGSQSTSAILLAVVLLPVILHDSVIDLSQRLSLNKNKRSLAGRSADFMAVAVFLALLFSQTRSVAKSYSNGVPLDLPGARLIHVSQASKDNLHWLARELTSCPSFYTMTGYFSLYFWTEQKAPTAFNNPDPFGLFSNDQQQRIISDLEKQPHLCIVKLPHLIEFFDRGQVAKNPPLLRYIQDHFKIYAERGGVEVHKPN